MLNIAPLDYERYAALYGPPPPLEASNTQAVFSERIIETIDPISSELKRHGSTFGGKLVTPESEQKDSNDFDRSVNIKYPTVLPAFFNLSDNLLNVTPIQLGLSPEKVTALYDHQIEKTPGTTRITA